MFGSGGTCSACKVHIASDELVMRVQRNVYHVKCFKCVQCKTTLQPGDRCSLHNGELYCEHEFGDIFANCASRPPWPPSDTTPPPLPHNHQFDSKLTGFTHNPDKSSFSTYFPANNSSSQVHSKSQGSSKGRQKVGACPSSAVTLTYRKSTREESHYPSAEECAKFAIYYAATKRWEM
ncbi:LIM domain only 4 [Cichlidogyrus casuarinus]|uniref:LIM domain only 4 n=1 Tax=Cichlidogyrus casuarinus TaxID=1844966 RepID=A0ABD2Q5C0_9PLAT